MSKINREQLEAWGMSDTDLRITLECETYAGIAWLAWQAATNEAEAQLTALTSQLESVVAENAALLKFCKDASFDADYEAELGMERGGFTDALNDIKTPATDAFLAEVRAQAHKEGAHFVANRMLAAWEAGFIDDTAKNAADIARMILTSTEFMAEAPEGDFDRSFADGVLEDIAAQLRQGGAQ
ncbi:hypothetical protein [Lelliottia amnigena]|uniref:hypothetical protein n=1 Tax=Lelliottia amnigena TaxID=61646 RepID=UPI001F0F7C50|nr:hypothetical protein [Lelliottia amnigena]